MGNLLSERLQVKRDSRHVFLVCLQKDFDHGRRSLICNEIQITVRSSQYCFLTKPSSTRSIPCSSRTWSSFVRQTRNPECVAIPPSYKSSRRTLNRSSRLGTDLKPAISKILLCCPVFQISNWRASANRRDVPKYFGKALKPRKFETLTKIVLKLPSQAHAHMRV